MDNLTDYCLLGKSSFLSQNLTPYIALEEEIRSRIVYDVDTSENCNKIICY
jgi:hypothetical protein